MGAFIRLLQSLIVFAGGFYVLYQILSFVFGVGGGRKTNLKKDLKMLREELSPWLDKLVPWKTSEMDLLSLDREETVKRKGWTKTVTGVIKSIYSEPLAAYAYKLSKKDRMGMLLVRTAEHEIIYEGHNREVKVYVDGVYIGQLLPDGRLMSEDGRNIIARAEEGLSMKAITIGQKEVAMLNPGNISENYAGRAFEHVESLSEEEAKILTAMSMYEILRNE